MVMNSNYLQEYTHLLERLFSFAYENDYSYKALEKDISCSLYFQLIEKDYEAMPPVIDGNSLARANFVDPTIDLNKVSSYNQCAWAAEAYLRIQGQVKLSFEAIFLYIPITKMFEYFPLFHEMDFVHIINEFKRLYSKESVLSILLANYNYPLKYVSQKIGLPYDTLYSYKQRRRDIKKMNAEAAYKLASLFRVRMETLLELELYATVLSSF